MTLPPNREMEPITQQLLDTGPTFISSNLQLLLSCYILFPPLIQGQPFHLGFRSQHIPPSQAHILIYLCSLLFFFSQLLPFNHILPISSPSTSQVLPLKHSTSTSRVSRLVSYFFTSITGKIKTGLLGYLHFSSPIHFSTHSNLAWFQFSLKKLQSRSIMTSVAKFKWEVFHSSYLTSWQCLAVFITPSLKYFLPWPSQSMLSFLLLSLSSLHQLALLYPFFRVWAPQSLNPGPPFLFMLH